jgi:hypothetical protein
MERNDDYPTILQPDSKGPPEVPSVQPGPTGTGVLDEQALRVIEVDELFRAADHTSTRVGRAVLYRSLARPLTSAQSIREKQEALREIAGNGGLRAELEKLLTVAARGEGEFYHLLYAQFLGMMSKPAHPLEIEGYGYATYLQGTRFLREVVERIERLAVTSRYLQGLVERVRAFRHTREYALLEGPVYRTEKGVCTRAEKRWFTPAIRFRPSLFKPVGLSLTVGVLLAVLTLIPFALEMAASIAPVFWLFLLPMGFVYVPIVGSFDRDGVIYPLREIFRRSRAVHDLMDVLGQWDELLSFLRFREAFLPPLCLPEIRDGERHFLRLKGARNPVLAKEDPGYVPNDIDLSEHRLTFITGPNSGGKTAFCKTLAQIQLLAQVGCYVPAERAELTVADHIFYQVPEVSHLTDREGRFGTELKRTKDIFLASTPRSLVIMDELSEGTTNEEKMDISIAILDGFREKGCTTVLITHNHELVDFYQNRTIGLARQAEFRNEQPTYRLIEGVSRVSHADRIAKKIGFSREDIARYLKGGSGP